MPPDDRRSRPRGTQRLPRTQISRTGRPNHRRWPTKGADAERSHPRLPVREDTRRDLRGRLARCPEPLSTVDLDRDRRRRSGPLQIVGFRPSRVPDPMGLFSYAAVLRKLEHLNPEPLSTAADHAGHRHPLYILIPIAKNSTGRPYTSSRKSLRD